MRLRFRDAAINFNHVNLSSKEAGTVAAACTCGADDEKEPEAVGIPAQLEKMNRDNEAFWAGEREEESDVPPGRENGIPAQLEAMNRRNADFWRSRL